jgi:peptide/nickel transport system substrate-binding protein
VRRALNYAVDRDAAVRAFGGREWAAPHCQVLPPNFPGYRPYCPYARNVERARRLVAASGTIGMRVVVTTRAFAVPVTRPVIEALRMLGYRARMDVISDERFGQVIGTDEIQMAIWAWQADYPSAATWIPPQYSCAGNQSGFCDRSIDRMMKKAIQLQATNPATTNEIWAEVDRKLTNQAPFLHLLSGQLPYFVSDRVGNYQYHPVHELLLDQLWVR